MIKQDIKNCYEKFKKYNSEVLYNCLISLLSRYLTTLNIKNNRIEYYEITFYIDNREYLLYYKEFDNSFVIFDKKKNKSFFNENELFDYIENNLLKKEANNEKTI